MPYCKKCGYELDDDALFCPNCGTPVVKPKGDKSEGEVSIPEDTGGTLLNVNKTYGKMDIEKLPEGYEIEGRYRVIEKRYDEDYYSKSPIVNPEGPAKGKYKVLRGGSWIYNDNNCRTTNRVRFKPGFWNNYLGFRLVRDL